MFTDASVDGNIHLIKSCDQALRSRKLACYVLAALAAKFLVVDLRALTLHRVVKAPDKLEGRIRCRVRKTDYAKHNLLAWFERNLDILSLAIDELPRKYCLPDINELSVCDLAKAEKCRQTDYEYEGGLAYFIFHNLSFLS